MVRNKILVTQTINFLFEIQNSRFEVGYHRIVDRRMRERLIDFFLEDLFSLFDIVMSVCSIRLLRLTKIVRKIIWKPLPRLRMPGCSKRVTMQGKVKCIGKGILHRASGQLIGLLKTEVPAR